MRGRERDDSRLDNFITHDALSSLNLTDSDWPYVILYERAYLQI
jgi:hypothetical protein